MSTTELTQFFEERYTEVQVHLSFLRQVETALQHGIPRLCGTNAPITTEQNKILNSSFYLQLYNLIEATIAQCLEAIATAIENSELPPNELTSKLRTE
jgi:hypothetical protein